MKTLCVLLLLFCCQGSLANEDSPIDKAVFSANQTSASMLLKYAEKQIEQAEDPALAEKRYLLLFDIYIKARSYAILNKVFFWLSVVAGLGVLLWPSLSIIFKQRLDKWEWLKSATVQTTVTGIAALMFAFYVQYKDKQTYAETLMRHVLYSDQTVPKLAVKVSEELARIDRGFSFNSIVNNDQSD